MSEDRPKGEYPESRIFKAFSKLDHALSFIQLGKFRMGSLHSYRETEDDTRRDQREGSAHIQTPGTIALGHIASRNPDFFETTEEQGLQQHHMEIGNPIYIFSTSIEGVDIALLRARWPYIVSVEEPRQLALDISAHLQTKEGFKAGVEGRIVRYDYGEVISEQLDDRELVALRYYQKPVCFAEESEFRLVVIDVGGESQRVPHEFIEINLGAPIPYSSLLPE